MVDKNGQMVSQWKPQNFSVDSLLQQDCTMCLTTATSTTDTGLSTREIGLIVGLVATGLMTILLATALICNCTRSSSKAKQDYPPLTSQSNGQLNN